MEWELIKTTDTFKQMWKSWYQPIFLEVYKAIQQGIKEGIFRKNLNPEGACIYQKVARAQISEFMKSKKS